MNLTCGVMYTFPTFNSIELGVRDIAVQVVSTGCYGVVEEK